ncbi:hypothetical protein, partial [Dubosiella newyorkensis]|uniref:hypothetical protein n=3 Tax=Dubosiella newyorkensis TaxID=1862672 RepID=UPI003DA8834A
IPPHSGIQIVLLMTFYHLNFQRFKGCTINTKSRGDASAEPDPGSEFEYTITAEDASGNQSKAVIKIRIQDEKKEEENTSSESENNGTSTETKPIENIPMESTPAPAQPVTPPVQQPAIAAPPVQNHTNKSYMFSDGYTLQTAPSACQSDLMASGASGACMPIQDADGIYKGMQLIFD